MKFLYAEVFITKVPITFICNNKDKNVLYNNINCFFIDLYHRNHKIMWSDGAIGFSGVPFVIVGSKTLDCHFGKDRNLRIKQRKMIMVIIFVELTIHNKRL